MNLVAMCASILVAARPTHTVPLRPLSSGMGDSGKPRRVATAARHLAKAKLRPVILAPMND